jgi:hypothetical protein
MGLFSKFKAGLAKTHARLTQEIKRIVTRSPKLTAESLEEIEHALIAADLGVAMTTQIVAAVKLAYETQGTAGLDYLAIAQAEIEGFFRNHDPKLREMPGGTASFPSSASTAPARPRPAPSSRIIFRRRKRPCCSPRATPSAPRPSSNQTLGNATESGRHRRRATARTRRPWRTTP